MPQACSRGAATGRRPRAGPPLPSATQRVARADGTMQRNSTGMRVEDVRRAMLRPQIKAWLDANMPEIVEKLAREEIKRLTGKL